MYCQLAFHFAECQAACPDYFGELVEAGAMIELFRLRQAQACKG
jgi:hypothetical protein